MARVLKNDKCFVSMGGKAKRMLLFGYGYGHNAEGKIRSLKETSLFDVVFIAYQFDEAFREKYPYIKFVPLNYRISIKRPLESVKCFFVLYKQIRGSGGFDVVYSLGIGGAMVALLFFLTPKKTKKALELWSIHIIDKARRNKSISERLDRYVIDRADLICQYWWGVRDHFIKSFPQFEDKFLMYQLSYADIYFSNEHHSPASNFAKDFLNTIPKEQVVCFWPRSFIPSNNHKLLLDSLGLIKRERPELMDKFKLYLWGGNAESKTSRATIEKAIRENVLDDNVVIVEHPFVPQNDIFAIEERSNFFVQIANDDILSTYVMEMICSVTPFILSNLSTFRYLNEKYDLNIDLVENEVKPIADRIIDILSGNIVDDVTEYERRKAICFQHFAKSKVTLWFTTLYNNV